MEHTQAECVLTHVCDRHAYLSSTRAVRYHRGVECVEISSERDIAHLASMPHEALLYVQVSQAQSGFHWCMGPTGSKIGFQCLFVCVPVCLHMSVCRMTSDSKLPSNLSQSDH